MSLDKGSTVADLDPTTHPDACVPLGQNWAIIRTLFGRLNEKIRN